MNFDDLGQDCRDLVFAFWSPAKQISYTNIQFLCHESLLGALEMRDQIAEQVYSNTFDRCDGMYYCFTDYLEAGYKLELERKKKYARWYVLRELERSL